mmetsp:Transcript_98719/g.304236  ORF Transcript_98719/g.304236 Transcript_98719/m.304236 type:complete len:230 (+) Transcript_98719:792-1481(+)
MAAAQELLARFCGSWSAIRAMEASRRFRKRGSSLTASVAYAHIMLDRLCGSHVCRMSTRRSTSSATARNIRLSQRSSVASAQAKFESSCGMKSWIFRAASRPTANTMLSFRKLSVARPQTKFDMFCGEKSANSRRARTTARNHSTSFSFRVAQAQVTIDTSRGHDRGMSSMALPRRACNINGSFSCIRAQAHSVFETCCGSKSRMRRCVWMLTICTQEPCSRYMRLPKP